MQNRDPRQLALSFTRPVAPHDARRLRLTFGQVDNNTSLPENPVQPKPKRRQIPAVDCVLHVGRILESDVCAAIQNSVQLQIVDVFAFANSAPQTISGCLKISWQQFTALNRAYRVQQNHFTHLSGCLKSRMDYGIALTHCATPQQTATVWYAQCNTAKQSAFAKQAHCYTQRVGRILESDICTTTQQSALNTLSGCLKPSYSKAIPPPCEWYEIKLPEQPDNENPNQRACGKLPPSNRLPLSFTRKSREQDSRRLRLSFTCNQDFIAIAELDSYMILNNITAQADGKPLELLSANVSADTSGYYWSGDVTLPPDEFARLNLDARDDDCVIELHINGEAFHILAESYRDNRQFGRRSYTVSGRSRTAKLGADYATSYQGFITQARNARQIADEAVAHLGMELDWQIDDWLVPANVYSRSDKTPMGILADIANAAGAFVESHPSLPKIAIKPRWRIPAWQLNSASAAVSVPSNVILSISGSKTVNAQANGVFVWGTHAQGFAADVWRDGSNREPRATAQNHVLYTAAEVCRMAGIAALSQTGTHKQESVQLPLAPKYGINRAELGRVWRFHEPNGAWQGIVTGVSISAESNDGAVKVVQTLMIDRYLGM